MINITFNPDKWEVKVEGHANHGEKGEDIVCAAISTLFYTLCEAIYESKEMLACEPSFSEEDGNGYISCKPKEEFEGNMARTYMTIIGGFRLIAENYKKNVKFSVVVG